MTRTDTDEAVCAVAPEATIVIHTHVSETAATRWHEILFIVPSLFFIVELMRVGIRLGPDFGTGPAHIVPLGVIFFLAAQSQDIPDQRRKFLHGSLRGIFPVCFGHVCCSRDGGYFDAPIETADRNSSPTDK